MIFEVIGINRHRIGIDGRGVTTLVGLAGCPLNCKYCLNLGISHCVKPKQLTSEKLLRLVMKDYCYFVATHGGITFGGGEPLLHYKQIIEFRNLLPIDISINLETSLNFDSNAVKYLADIIKEWIIDIKDTNNTIYEAYTGKTFDTVLENLKLLANLGLQDKCTVRVPLIPNYNTDIDRTKSLTLLNRLGYINIEKFDYLV